MSLTLFRGGLVFDGGGAEARDGLEVLVEGARIKEVSDRPITAAGARVAVLGGEGQGIVLVMKGGEVFKDTL